jgi:hypothetical protein
MQLPTAVAGVVWRQSVSGDGAGNGTKLADGAEAGTKSIPVHIAMVSGTTLYQLQYWPQYQSFAMAFASIVNCYSTDAQEYQHLMMQCAGRWSFPASTLIPMPPYQRSAGFCSCHSHAIVVSHKSPHLHKLLHLITAKG